VGTAVHRGRGPARGLRREKTITYGGAPLPDDRLDGYSADGGTLQVVLTLLPTRLALQFVDAKGAAVPDGDVVVFAHDRALWREGSRSLRAVRTDGMGTFDVTGLPAGPYFAAALPDVEDGAWADPELLERLRRGAVDFTLDEGEQRTIAVVSRIGG
jgi:hypothetical protein